MVCAVTDVDRWPAQADLDRHTGREWLVAVRRRFDDGLLAREEVIENINKKGGFASLS